MLKSYTVAVVVPIRNTMEKLALDLGKTFSDYEDLCKDKEIVQVTVVSSRLPLLTNILNRLC